MHSNTFPSYDEPGFGRPPSLLFNVVYCSRAAAGVDATAVDQIIATSRRNNARLDITGMLVFGEGIFFQWLEGPRESIMDLMERLRSDSRHSQIVMLSAVEESNERLFPQWDMELVEAEEIRVVLIDALEDDHQPSSMDALRAMLAELDARLGTPSSLKA